jgi:hypothetical protein
MSIVASLIGPVTGLLDKFIEDKDQKNALAHEIATMSDRAASENALAQIELNKAEAQRMETVCWVDVRCRSCIQRNYISDTFYLV